MNVIMKGNKPIQYKLSKFLFYVRFCKFLVLILYFFVVVKGERMVFGLNGRGFIIPLMIRLKLENIFGEFGVCSHLTKVNAEKEYVFFSNEGNILDVSENLYNMAFMNVCPLSKYKLLFAIF